jgi:hypothetical protein
MTNEKRITRQDVNDLLFNLRQAATDAERTALLETMRARRRARVMRARCERPEFIVATLKTSSAGRANAFTTQTQRNTEREIDVLASSVLLNSGAAKFGFDVDIRHSRARRSFFTTDDRQINYAGTAGFVGDYPNFQYFDRPPTLERNEYLTFDVYQRDPTGTGKANIVNFYLYGRSVIRSTADEAQLDPKEAAKVEELIKARSVPEERVAVALVTLPDYGLGTFGAPTLLETPTFDEPMLIKGFRCPGANTGPFLAQIDRLRIDDRDPWMDREIALDLITKPVIGGDPAETERDWFQFSTPVFMREGSRLRATIRGGNSTPSVNFEVLAETV